MDYYQKHIFFCTNQKESGRTCCENAGATDAFLYAKQLIKKKKLEGKGKFRVTRSGCLGRCNEGPCIVIYPEGIWYTYHSLNDVKKILEEYVIHGKIIKELLLDTRLS